MISFFEETYQFIVEETYQFIEDFEFTTRLSSIDDNSGPVWLEIFSIVF